MSQIPFFYHDGELLANELLSLHEDTAKHVVQVLRKKEGDLIQLNNGKGRTALAALTSAGKKHCVVRLQSTEQHAAPSIQLHLAVAFTKNASRNEWLLEKATELGVSSITPLLSERTEREKFREDRARNILISAMLQSQQYYLPELYAPSTLKQIAERADTGTLKLIAHCDPQSTRNPISKVLSAGKDVWILIGPEGDFSPAEITQMEASGFAGIALCEQRLRTETAAMAVCAYFNLLNGK
ncbi:RsmE family RNA methyltransferase [Rurimicrobium arvi]|uniref:Ribosomal RNA small subunit methyltransferase E n=1 Tax=Rurimicrobium arvi TaxID=2049916 RepID=A0ABP8MSI6_9BACT